MHGFHCSFLLLSLLVMFPYNAKHRGSCPEVFCKEGAPKNCCSFNKKRHLQRCFLVNLANFFKTTYFEERLRTPASGNIRTEVRE